MGVLRGPSRDTSRSGPTSFDSNNLTESTSETEKEGKGSEGTRFTLSFVSDQHLEGFGRLQMVQGGPLPPLPTSRETFLLCEFFKVARLRVCGSLGRTEANNPQVSLSPGCDKVRSFGT